MDSIDKDLYLTGSPVVSLPGAGLHRRTVNQPRGTVSSARSQVSRICKCVRRRAEIISK